MNNKDKKGARIQGFLFYSSKVILVVAILIIGYILESYWRRRLLINIFIHLKSMMIKWHNIHSVNVKEIDEQHKEMVGIINRFFKFDHSDKAGLLKIVAEMNDYANRHLSTEEKYFIKFQYPGAEVHTKLHQSYRDKIQEFIARLQTGDTAKVCADMSEFLGNWWIYHINTIDQEYVEFFNQQGLY